MHNNETWSEVAEQFEVALCAFDKMDTLLAELGEERLRTLIDQQVNPLIPLIAFLLPVATLDEVASRARRAAAQS